MYALDYQITEPFVKKKQDMYFFENERSLYFEQAVW